MSRHYALAQRKATQLFWRVSENCLAYQHFLEQHHFQKGKIKSARDFTAIPISDKNSYFRRFSLNEKLYVQKEVADYYMLCTSTGSTGEPTIWPRDFETDQRLEKLHTDFLDMHFGVRHKKTLIVISFGLGANTAGMLHAQLSWAASRHRKISVITPGIDAEKTVTLIQSLYSHYEQVVCIGYPPFIAEFVNLALQRKMPIKKWRLKVIFTSESVSAQWRREMAQKISEDGDPRNVVAFYASTEAGIVGIETLETHSILSQCLKNKKLHQNLFGSMHLPTLVQVNFLRKFVEVVDGEIVLTVDQPLPLIRYNIHDRGLLITAQRVREAMAEQGLKFAFNQANKDALFLAVFGKNEKLSGDISFRIEDIRSVVESISFRKKFANEFQYETQNKVVTIKLYLQKGASVTSSQQKKIKAEIEKKLQAQFKEVRLKLFIADHQQKIGYVSGKLRYFLKHD